jgi:hypothetical protein
MDKILDHARKGKVIVLAGAGVSAGRPSSLPGWKPLNQAIIESLSSRLETALGWGPSRLGEWNEQVVEMLNSDRFPPEYQAQLIEEMCGERYFRALQALDVDVSNSGHRGIAALASAGALKAIVTTNFDRLIEKELARQGVAYEVAYDDQGFESLEERLGGETLRGIPLIKIHGCASAHLSMIDTLKQRQRGRSRYLQGCLDALGPDYWLYLGFSAADLESDDNYLGLIDRAKRSEGGTYLARPASHQLRKGAQMLMNAHGQRGSVEQASIEEYLPKLCGRLGAEMIADESAEDEAGLEQFRLKLKAWSDGLSPAAAGLCLAAIYEAVGNAEAAVRVLDRLVRKDIDERDNADFRALQLHYGRLGAAWGRFISVPNLDGIASNPTTECEQSLMRILDSETGFAAASWLIDMFLWMGMGEYAQGYAADIMDGFQTGEWGKRSPRSDEEVADAWISAAQFIALNENPEWAKFLHSTHELAIGRARAAGDVVRSARILALDLLALARTNLDVPALSMQYEPEFKQAIRIGDGFALGIRSLALGRWYVSGGGLELAAATAKREEIAEQAMDSLNAALSFFDAQGMDPWSIYSIVQMAKALGDLQLFDQSYEYLEKIKEGLDRFPVLLAHTEEAVWQLCRMDGVPEVDAIQHLQNAIDSAEYTGMVGLREMLKSELAYWEQKQASKSQPQTEQS